MKIATVAKENLEKARVEDVQNFNQQVQQKEQQLAEFIQEEQTRQGQAFCLSFGVNYTAGFEI